ncbi:hypothetical protein Pth03_33060 [Planotetraspora thailandica]|uniref:Uncharacterized protein n=1 Tax=Planotetraspora thailandica TaxID=487172 RepID=A0A8J3V096_9ACTN|nr:hypothetical protein [Planotetraspora thailandica]GII54917.1 hypothetical protein Pth03_33060 [Planotetraspora thailandica]
MKRLAIVLTAPLALLVAAVLPAQAQNAYSGYNAYFVQASAALSVANLNVSFMEAGLGNNPSVDYIASADAAATYVCVNEVGVNPRVTNKRTVTAPVSQGATFNPGDRGQVTATVTLAPPPAGAFSCPAGQSLELAQVSYTNVDIMDDTNNITAPIVGTFATQCLLPEVRNACSAIPAWT